MTVSLITIAGSFRKSLDYFRDGINTMSRALKLQLIPQIIQWKQKRERKKTAVYKSRSSVVLHVLLHLAPICGSLTLVILNVNEYFHEWPMSDNLPALQFVAKLLEILIQASIAAVVLAYVRSKLLGGVPPFGSVVAPYQIADVSSLWSLEFWGAITSSSTPLNARILLGALVAFAIVLAALIGPSTAILLIPRPQRRLWWTEASFFQPEAEVFPTNIELVNGRIW